MSNILTSFKLHRILVFLLSLSSPALAGNEGMQSNYFEKAKAYTVKVRTRVEYPFGKDKRGSFSGAGFLIDREAGWIITNAHVSSRNPANIEIAFKGENFIDARLYYIDQLLDLAVLQLATDKIPIRAEEAQLECIKKPVIGSPVGAFGHPFSLSFSGTRGIVSGERYRWNRYWVQTDAPINKGNSGGPLIDLTNGKVIGINSATYSKGKSEGLGFAVPMTHVCRLIELLKQKVDPSPSYIPVSFAGNKDNEEELIVAAVYKKQPVSWPLRSGDRILALAESPQKPMNNQADLIHALRGKVGDVQLVIKRGETKKTVTIKSHKRANLLDRVGIHVSGIVLGKSNFKDDEIINPENLFFVHDVADASIASLSDVSSYSYLLSVDGQKINKIDLLCKYLLQAQSDKQKIEIVLRRKGWNYRAQLKYSKHEISVNNVKLVGPKAPASCH